MERRLSHNGVEMLYTIEGEGSDVVLMHGWGCTHSTVESIAAVARKAHRVFNVDFPGFGGSTEPPLGATPWGVEEYTQMIERLAEVENIKNPILIGHSFGGRVAIVYASRNAVDKVVLVDAAGVKTQRQRKPRLSDRLYRWGKCIFPAILGKRLGGRIVARWAYRRGSADYKACSEAMRPVFVKVVNEDLCHLMPQIKAPTLLIWGKNDTATPLADAQKMESLIPDAGLVAFDGCGHYSFLDNPRGFSAVLDNFINPHENAS